MLLARTLWQIQRMRHQICRQTQKSFWRITSVDWSRRQFVEADWAA